MSYYLSVKRQSWKPWQTDKTPSSDGHGRTDGHEASSSLGFNWIPDMNESEASPFVLYATAAPCMRSHFLNWPFCAADWLQANLVTKATANSHTAKFNKCSPKWPGFDPGNRIQNLWLTLWRVFFTLLIFFFFFLLNLGNPLVELYGCCLTSGAIWCVVHLLISWKKSFSDNHR